MSSTVALVSRFLSKTLLLNRTEVTMLISRAAAHCAALVVTAVTGLVAQTPVGVWGTDTSNVWAVGPFQAPLHFDGRAWASVPLGGEPTVRLFAVWGSGPADVFGGGENLGIGTILRWDGRAWTTMTVPTRNPIVAIAGRSGTEVYALARSGLLDRAPSVLKWDGRAWQGFELPMPFFATSMALHGDEVLVAGYFEPGQAPAGARSPGVLARLRGGQWSLTGRSGQAVTDSAVGAARWSSVLVAGDTVYLVGELEDGKSTILTSTGGAWSALAPPAEVETSFAIKLAFLAGDGSVLALLTGGVGYSRWKGGAWTVVRPPDRYNPPPSMNADELLQQTLAWDEISDVRAAWGPSSSDFCVVTNGGRVVRFRDGSATIEYDASCRDPEIAARSPICRMLRRP